MLHICVCRQSWSKWFYCTWASDTNNPLIACDASGENVINVEQVSCLKKNWVHSTPVISRHYSLLGEMCSVKAVLLLKLDPQCAQCVERIVWQQMNEENISHLTAANLGLVFLLWNPGKEFYMCFTVRKGFPPLWAKCVFSKLSLCSNLFHNMHNVGKIFHQKNCEIIWNMGISALCLLTTAPASDILVFGHFWIARTFISW